MVSFLNLSVVGLLLSTFTTRFIFPMISLEGRRFWILGLLPRAARNDSLEQVPVRRRRVDHPLLQPGPAERPDARRVARWWSSAIS